MVVLISTLLLVVGQFANVANLQQSTEHSATIDRVLQGLIERVNAAEFKQLATTRAPWSVARYELGAIPSRPPMRLFAPDTRDDLRALGLVPSDGLIDDLRIYFEYYRAVDFTDGAGVPQEGLLDEAPESSAEWRTDCYIDPTQPVLGVRTAFRLAGWDQSNTAETNNPGVVAGLLGPNDPLLIRIIAVWDNGAQRRELFTARSP